MTINIIQKNLNIFQCLCSFGFFIFLTSKPFSNFEKFRYYFPLKFKELSNSLHCKKDSYKNNCDF